VDRGQHRERVQKKRATGKEVRKKKPRSLTIQGRGKKPPNGAGSTARGKKVAGRPGVKGGGVEICSKQGLPSPSSSSWKHQKIRKKRCEAHKDLEKRCRKSNCLVTKNWKKGR